MNRDEPAGTRMKSRCEGTSGNIAA